MEVLFPNLDSSAHLSRQLAISHHHAKTESKLLLI